MKRRLYIALLVLLLTEVDAAAQVACPGLKNPINFAMYPSYSGRIGSKPLNSRSICGTNQLGMVFTNDIIPNTQLAAQTSVANRYFCALGTIEDDKRFRIMSYDEGTCQGWLQGRDPNTNCYLPYCPPGFEKSIRVGQCRIMAEAEALYYTMTVTPDNALVFVNYAIVVQAPGHGVTQDPEFVVRVTRQNGTSFDPISDTLCYVVSSTPVNEGGTVVLGQDGWHGDGSGDYRVFYRDWNKVAINLYNYLYQNVRIEIMICDCGGTGHYGYCYVAGDCQSMRLEVNSCAAGETEDVATIAAPSGLAAYQWYKSRT
ncbi:MAG: hypothetical protein J6X62_04535 [Bacteroidales bacterium]|nr:hypothetical protein [Bacteroidales bacterium]